MKLTAETARALPLPRSGETGRVIRCHVVRGLELHAKPTGKVWLFYYRVDGVRRRPKLGVYPEMGIEEARKIADSWRKRVNRGEDPSAERTARREAPTVNELCDIYLSLPNQPKRAPWKPRTREEYERNINLHVRPRIGHLKVADVTLKDVSDLLAAVARPAARGHQKSKTAAPGAANRVRANLSGLFSLAEHSDYKFRPKGSNPVAETSLNRERKRKRHITSDEFPAIAKALDFYEPEYPSRVAAIRCILFAGTRVTEFLMASPAQRDGNRVTLEEHKTERTGDDRVLILPRQAVEIIEALPVRDPKFIFGEELTRYHLYHVWTLVRDKAGCPDIQVRDLRRTFASVAKSTGHSLDSIGELFGHKDAQTTRRYAHLFEERGDAIAQDVGDKIAERMAG